MNWRGSGGCWKQRRSKCSEYGEAHGELCKWDMRAPSRSVIGPHASIRVEMTKRQSKPTSGPARAYTRKVIQKARVRLLRIGCPGATSDSAKHSSDCAQAKSGRRTLSANVCSWPTASLGATQRNVGSWGQSGLTWKWRWSILRPNDRELVTVRVDELMAQYSSANMMVMTRSVMDGSDGSSE